MNRDALFLGKKFIQYCKWYWVPHNDTWIMKMDFVRDPICRGPAMKDGVMKRDLYRRRSINRGRHFDRKVR